MLGANCCTRARALNWNNGARGSRSSRYCFIALRQVGNGHIGRAATGRAVFNHDPRGVDERDIRIEKPGQVDDRLLDLLLLADVTKDEHSPGDLTILHDRGTGVLGGETRTVLAPEQFIADGIRSAILDRRLDEAFLQGIGRPVCPQAMGCALQPPPSTDWMLKL